MPEGVSTDGEATRVAKRATVAEDDTDTPSAAGGAGDLTPISLVDTGAVFTIKLLVPSRVAGGVIGRAGENINTSRKTTGAKVDLAVTLNSAERVVRGE